MTPREALLDRIAAGLRRASAAGAPHDRASAASPAPAGAVSPGALIERFTTVLTALAGHPHIVDGPRAAVDVVLDICRSHRARRVLAWEPRPVGIDGLREALAAAGIASDAGALPPADGPEDGRREARLAELAAIPVGITGTIGGIAESGTIAVVSGPGRSRLASLLPPVHLAVLMADRLHASLGAFLAANPHVADEGSNLVLITGPSRTADIEMTLTRGVHGPGEIHVIVVTGEHE